MSHKSIPKVIESQSSIHIERRLLTEKEVSVLLGLSQAWLQKRRTYGGGPPYMKISGSVRYDRVLLDEWLKNQIHNNTGSYRT